MNRFDTVINSLLKEEELSDREKRIEALKSIPRERNFNVEVYGGRGIKTFGVTGDNIFNALRQMPENIFEDIFYGIVDFSNFEESEEEVLSFFNVCHGESGGINVNIYEDGQLICGCDVEDARNAEEEWEYDYEDEE